MQVGTLAVDPVVIWRRLRSTERVAGLYFLYVSALAVILPLAGETRLLVWGVNLLLAGLFTSLSHAPSALRDWLPAPLILLAYKQMGWLAQPHTDTSRETAWVTWDRMVLGEWGVKALIESAGPIIPGLLELCYLLVYAMVPVSIALATIYARERVEELTFPLLVTCLITYGLFPFFPSEPPRAVFPTDLVPTYQTLFRQINWYICGGYGIHTSVFPSGHVSSAIAATAGVYRLMPKRRWAWGALALITTGIFIATVYGRYHYLVDSLAGALVAALVLATLPLPGKSGRVGPGAQTYSKVHGFA